MHEVIKRYAAMGKVALVNRLTLALWRLLPSRLKELAVAGFRWARRGRLPSTRFVIFAQGRSGSTLLVDLLNSHPQISCLAEIFAGHVISGVRDPVGFAEGLLGLGRLPAGGFKVKIYQISRDQRRDPAEFLARFHRRGWKLIHLRRENVLRQAVSDLRSEMTREFHQVGAREPAAGGRAPVAIPPRSLLESMARRREYLAAEERALAGLPHLTLRYEQDLLEPEARARAMDRVFAYLGLPPHRAETAFRKVLSSDLSQVLANYEQVRRALVEAGEGGCLEG
jgi:LPS sulfotransferase NodH